MTWEQAEAIAQANFDAIREEYRQRFTAFPPPESDGAGWWLKVMNEANDGIVHLVAKARFLAIEEGNITDISHPFAEARLDEIRRDLSRISDIKAAIRC